MFDWNDEELSNIIWGEHGESQDHIVPYPDAKEDILRGYRDSSKKEPNKESITSKYTESKETITVTELHEQESSPEHDKRKYYPGSELNMDSWPDQESLESERPDNMSNISRNDADIGSDETTARPGNKAEYFENCLEDSDQGDFVDYSWASVGSFEDLDRIFSNEDAILGHGSLCNPIEPWSPSKDVISSTEKSISPLVDCPQLDFGMLKRSAEQFEGQEEYLPNQTQSFRASDIPRDINKSCSDSINYSGSSGNLLLKEKVNRQKRLVKSRKMLEEKSETSHLQNLQVWTPTGNPLLQIDSAYAPNVGPPGSSFQLGQQGQLQGTVSAQCNHISNPSLLAFNHGNIMKHYPPIMSHPGESSQQSVLSGYEVPSYNLNLKDQFTKARMKSSMMTPQEKIEKLRKRQQMRARLAIQKQQQQFGNQVSSTEYSCGEGEHGEAEENLSIFSSVDPSSPAEPDNSNTVCMAPDDCPVQDFILYQLQDIARKLDLRVRLCIRDSLYRLAQSASQRQYSGDTSSSNKDSRCDTAGKEQINHENRFQKTSEAETETNPIDRTVAYLLFHKRVEPLGKHFQRDSLLAVKLKASGSVRSEQPDLNAKQDHMNSRSSFNASATSNDPDNGDNKVEDTT